MRLLLLAVGRLKEGPERLLFNRYHERSISLARPLGMTGPDLHEITESRASQATSRMREEAKILQEKIGDGAFIALDERGTSVTSPLFADWLRKSRENGEKSLAFVIGGADGLDQDMRTKARHVMAFGAMTLPHQLVRVLVAEQLYRAMTILSGHPYHRV